MRKFAAALLCLLLLLPATPQAHADAYHAKPKLVIILVIDQFRGDYLDRYSDDFKTPNGFNLFLKRGAYFTDCYYDYANTMTAPGHSTIGTGAYTDGHGISLNEWWDLNRSTTHVITSVEDERYADRRRSQLQRRRRLPAQRAGLHPRRRSRPRHPAASPNSSASPSRTAPPSSPPATPPTEPSGSTTPAANSSPPPTGRRSSPPGRRASTTVTAPPAPSAEAKARPGHFYDDVGASPASVSYLFDFAKSLVTGEKMGRHDVTDVLTISISSTDILGHKVGPDSPEQRAMIDAIDVHMNDFFTWLDKNVDGGMANVWVALTADHGVAPVPAVAAKMGIPAANIDVSKWTTALNAALNQRFAPGQNLKFVLGGEMPYIQLDYRLFDNLKVTEKDAEDAAAELLPAAVESTLPPLPSGTSDTRLPTRHIIRRVYTRVQMASGQLPATDEGRLILHSYSPNGGWYIMVTPGMYQVAGQNGTNHFAPYSYDRHVPLGFYGSAFVPGFYHDRVAPVDIASTFASLLRINQPSAAVGRVLTMALRPDTAATPTAPAKALAK